MLNHIKQEIERLIEYYSTDCSKYGKHRNVFMFLSYSKYNSEISSVQFAIGRSSFPVYYRIFRFTYDLKDKLLELKVERIDNSEVYNIDKYITQCIIGIDSKIPRYCLKMLSKYLIIFENEILRKKLLEC